MSVSVLCKTVCAAALATTLGAAAANAATIAALKDGEDPDLVRGQVMNAVRAAFRPEFLNRLDEVILFRRLSRDNMH